MEYSPYQDLDKLLNEYDEDSKTIQTDKFIMKNYPKVFVMSAASLFERHIKKRITNFCESPILPLETTYSQIVALSKKSPSKPISDKIFAKLEGYDANGIQTLCAEKFYTLFGGQPFKENVETNFTNELSEKIDKTNNIVNSLIPLLEQGTQYENDYAKNSNIKDKLDSCTFEMAEKAFLGLKLRRNRVAHDYINGLSDTFENIRDSFYIFAILYVNALEKSLFELTVA